MKKSRLNPLAENELHLKESEGFNFELSGGGYPSRFIFEIKEKLLVREGCLTKELVRTAQSFIQVSERLMDSAEMSENIKVGTRVLHKLFGNGEVVYIDEDNGTIEVQFDDTGESKHFSLDRAGVILTIDE